MSSLSIRTSRLSKLYQLGGFSSRFNTLGDALAGRVSNILGGFGKGKRGVISPRDTIWALKDVTFDIKAGEVVGLIGRNGAGKSTLLKILSRITEPTEGWAELYGRVGSLLEVGTGFHGELSGRENIMLNGAILGMSKAEILARFDEIVDFAEVARFIDTPVKHYSSGMYLRLAFAVAAHLETSILLVDEVLAVGDAAFQKKCLGKMQDLSGSGRTILFVSHNMVAISSLCTRALLIEDGRIEADGNPYEITERYLKAQGSSGFQYQNKELGFRITHVKLRNADGHEASTFRPFDDVCIEIGYEADKEIDNPYSWIRIESVHGPCFSANMLFDDHRLPSLMGASQIHCRFKSVPLLPQSYSIKMTVRTRVGRKTILPPQQVASFMVVADLGEFGLHSQANVQSVETLPVFVPYEWTFPDGSIRRVQLSRGVNRNQGEQAQR